MTRRMQPNTNPALTARESSDQVTLDGGAFDGWKMSRPEGRSLLIELPDGKSVARYRQSRDRDVFRFKEVDSIVARVSHPGEAA